MTTPSLPGTGMLTMPWPGKGWTAALLSLLLAGTLAMFWTFDRMEQASQGRSASADAVSDANRFLSHLNDAESGQRGYILTGDASYLQPYTRSLTELPQDLAALRDRVVQAPAQQRLDALAPLVQAKLLELAQSVAARQHQDLPGAMRIVGTGQGKGLMEAIRKELDGLVVTADADFQQFDASYRAHARRLYVGIVLASAVALLYGLVFAHTLVRNERQRLGNLLHLETRNLLQLQSQNNILLRQANATLRESEEKLAVTLASIGDAVIATDARGCITLINPAAQKLTGWAPAQAMGVAIAEVFRIVNKVTRAPVEVPVARALAQGVAQALTNHTVLIARDGREFDIADSCAPILNGEGAVIGAVLVFRNVTEEHDVQQALQDSAALVQTIFNTVEDGILTIHEQDARLEAVNPAIEHMFGYGAEALKGQGLALLIPELEAQWHSLARSAEGDGGRSGRGVVREVLGRRQDGSTFLLEMVLSAMVLHKQRFFTGILRDISVRKQAEAAQRQNSALQHAIFNSANFSSIATDTRGVIQIFNVGAERMLGYAAQDVLNKVTLAEISDPGENLLRARTLSQALGVTIQPGFESLVVKARRGMEDIYELTYIRKDGSHLPAVVSVSALRAEDRAIIGYLMIGTDNTARKVVEAEHQRLGQVLLDRNGELQLAREAADKANQAKSDFLSGMSHELRSPLNAILGFAQLMESAVPEPSPVQRASIEQILRAGWYLLELINEVLDLSLIESGKLSLSIEPMSLSEVLDDCHTLIKPLASKRQITLHFPPAHGTLHVAGDRTRVKQVLINLLSNAIKYNREGGSVHVACQETADARLRIGVQDSGEGLTPDKIEQLFQPFNRLGQEASASEGTGIGLVVSKRLVELMGGQIGMHSQVGVGSTFWIELPMSQATQPLLPAADRPAADSAAASVAGVRTLLYVEDNRANMELVEQLIARRPGLRLLGAADGMRAILLARLHLPELILMDINLPGISGLQALKILREDPATRYIPVLALSANALPRDVVRGLEAGFFRYLTKPVKVDEFMEALDEGLAMAAAHAHG